MLILEGFQPVLDLFKDSTPDIQDGSIMNIRRNILSVNAVKTIYRHFFISAKEQSASAEIHSESISRSRRCF